MQETKSPQQAVYSHGLLKKALALCADKTDCKKQDAIVISDGVYTIAKNINVTPVKQNDDLKKLVDSILNN